MPQTLYTKTLIIVVQASIVDQARAYAAQVDPNGATNTFGPELSPTGHAPATHYWVHWPLLVEQEVAIRGKLNQLTKSGKVQIFDGNVMTTTQVFTQLGLIQVSDTFD